jgi:hypothetical protein
VKVLPSERSVGSLLVSVHVALVYHMARPALQSFFREFKPDNSLSVSLVLAFLFMSVCRGFYRQHLAVKGLMMGSPGLSEERVCALDAFSFEP